MSHSSEIPAWATEKAGDVLMGNAYPQNESLRVKFRDDIARAIAEADRAATERAALWHEDEAHRIELEAHRKRGALAKTRQPIWHRRAAAAIRGAGQ